MELWVHGTIMSTENGIIGAWNGPVDRQWNYRCMERSCQQRIDAWKGRFDRKWNYRCMERSCKQRMEL